MKQIVHIIFLLSIVITSYTQVWEPIGPFYGKNSKGTYMHCMGYVSAIHMNAKDSNEILMGTNSSGIWKTQNGGKDWKCVTGNTELIPGMGIKNFSIDPSNSNVILATAGNFVYSADSYDSRLLISIDRGNTWNILKTFKTQKSQDAIVKVFHKNSDEIYVATLSELYYSTNKGVSWKSVFKLDKKKSYINHIGQRIVDFEYLKENTIIISSSHKWGGTGQVWKTNTNGKKWIDLIKSDELKELKGKEVKCVKLSKPLGKYSVISVLLGKEIYTYKTINRGDKYEKIIEFNTDHETGDAKASKFEVELSLIDSTKIYFGFIELFEWTKEKGLKRLSPTPNISKEEHDDVRTIKVYGNAKKEFLLMGNDGGVSLYYPESKKFKSLNGMSLPTVQVYKMGMSQYGEDFKILIGTQDNGTFQYQNNDWTWISGGDGGASWISKKGDKEFYCANSTLLFKKDGRIKRYYSPNKKRATWFLDYPAEAKSDEKTIVFGSKKGSGKNARLFIQKVSKRPVNGIEIEKIGGIGSIAISKADSNLIFIAANDYNDKNVGNSRLLKTTDEGENFIDLTNSVVTSDYDTTTLFDILNYRMVSDIEIDPLDDNVIYISLTGGIFNEYKKNITKHFYSILKSEDGGETWRNFSEGLPFIPINKIIRHAGAKQLIFCGTDKGLYYRAKGNNNWSVFNNGFPKNQAVSDLKINYCQDKLFCSTFGRGVWKSDLPNYKKEVLKIKNDTKLSDQEIFSLTDILIKKKKTLEVTGNLLLAKNCKIILEPKSKLIIKGGIVNTKCAGDWEKIEIKEKRFLFFFKRKKGKVIIIDKE